MMAWAARRSPMPAAPPARDQGGHPRLRWPRCSAVCTDDAGGELRRVGVLRPAGRWRPASRAIRWAFSSAHWGAGVGVAAVCYHGSPGLPRPPGGRMVTSHGCGRPSRRLRRVRSGAGAVLRRRGSGRGRFYPGRCWALTPHVDAGGHGSPGRRRRRRMT